MLRGKKGLTLIASIMLIVFASIAVLGVTTFIVERLRQYNVDQLGAKCIYLAQAGINNAVYFFRLHDATANGYFTLGQTNINPQNSFILGASAADALMVNTSVSALGGTGNRDLMGLTIQNAVNSQAITIDRMVVTWNSSRTLTIIRVNGSNKWTGNSSSPINADITNFALNTTPTIYTVNYLRFSGNMVGTTISIQFIMTDGSSKTLTVFPASQNNNFTVKASGQTSNSNIYRTMQAVYNAITAKIIDCDEISSRAQ
jgi:hypothetical protein